MEKTTIKDLTAYLKLLKEKYRFYQIGQENARYYIKLYDPYDYEEEEVTKEEHEQRYADEISSYRYILKNLEDEIREVKKKINKLNREQNGPKGLYNKREA